MAAILPWPRLLAVMEPFYPTGERGRPPVGLERLLRMSFRQQGEGLAAEAREDARYAARRGGDSPAGIWPPRACPPPPRS